jgi:hypothetical protein
VLEATSSCAFQNVLMYGIKKIPAAKLKSVTKRNLSYSNNSLTVNWPR